MESDSKEIISRLNGSTDQGNWEFFPTLWEVSREGEDFSSCVWSWVPRSVNGVADYVASHAGAEMCNLVWVRLPFLFVRVMNKDGLPCPPT